MTLGMGETGVESSSGVVLGGLVSKVSASAPKPLFLRLPNPLLRKLPVVFIFKFKFLEAEFRRRVDEFEAAEFERYAEESWERFEATELERYPDGW